MEDILYGVFRYEWIYTAQEAMDHLISVLPQIQSIHGTQTEVCHTWGEFVDGVEYVVNLCINLAENV